MTLNSPRILNNSGTSRSNGILIGPKQSGSRRSGRKGARGEISSLVDFRLVSIKRAIPLAKAHSTAEEKNDCILDPLLL